MLHATIPPATPVPHLRRILVVKFGDFGDVLNITPALRALRARFPQARLDVLTTRNGADALEGASFVDRVLQFNKRQFDQIGGATSPRALWSALRFAAGLRLRHYDTLVLLHHLITTWGTLKYTALALGSGAPIRAGLDNGRGWFLTHRVSDLGFGAVNERRYWLAVTASLGAVSDDDRPRYTGNAAGWARGQALLNAARRYPTQPVVVLHPTTGDYAKSRQWPADRFAAVADHLVRAHDAAIVLVGGPDALAETAAVAAAMTAPALDLAGQTDNSGLAALVRGANLVVANDSRVGHLAAALGTPTCSIFGPSNDRAWAPYAAQTVTLALDNPSVPPLPHAPNVIVRCADPHAPCLYIGYGPGNPAGCPHCRCLTGIDASRVATLVSQLLVRSVTSAGAGD